jgi:RES domain-containing protein
MEHEEVREADLPDNWTTNVETTRDLGDNWLQQCKTALLSVPSAITPSTRNFLLNPEHPHAGRVTVSKSWQFEFDPRLSPTMHFRIGTKFDKFYGTNSRHHP